MLKITMIFLIGGCIYFLGLYTENKYCVLCFPQTIVDINGDGKIDYEEEMEGAYLASTKEDRNFDGVFDTFSYFENGQLSYSIEDNDFNGSKETYVTYKFSQVEKVSVDTNGDEIVDFIVTHQSGIPKKIRFIQGGSGTELFEDEVILGVPQIYIDRLKLLGKE
jgi:hypothetical protein